MPHVSIITTRVVRAFIDVAGEVKVGRYISL